jgi:MoaA/NifB/PqqE/SkfB family radical SAM enzyme
MSTELLSNPSTDQARIKLAKSLIADGRTQDAIGILGPLVLANTACHEPYYELGLISATQGDCEGAVILQNLCLERNSCFLPSWRELASLYVKQGKFAEALNAMSIVLRSTEVLPDDYNLIREAVGKSPTLPPTTWIRLIHDLKALSPENRHALDLLDELKAARDALARENQDLKAKLEDVTSRVRALANSSPESIANGLKILLARTNRSARSFCALPWKHLDILQNGTVQLCCQGPKVVDEFGTALNLHDLGIMEIWNSPNMQAMRADMLVGIRPDGCSHCWKVEDAGGQSRRLDMMSGFEHTSGISGNQMQAILLDEANPLVRLEPPTSYQLDLGNICNLKCRTCGSIASSRIAADPIHLLWEQRQPLQNDEPAKTAQVSSAKVPAASHSGKCESTTRRHWYDSAEIIAGKILPNPKAISDLHIIGGEPLLASQFEWLIAHLGRGQARSRTRLAYTTNGTMPNDSLKAALDKFKRVSISLSFDGLGKYFEYIRYPGIWLEFVKAIDVYSGMKNINLSALPTFHMYNALNFADILEYCEERDIKPIFNPLRRPRQLAISALPPTARAAAVARLHAYSARSANAACRELANRLTIELRENVNPFEMELLEDFMLFTSDLDASRTIKFSDIYGEMIYLFAEDGIAWSDQTLYKHCRNPSATVQFFSET